MNLCAKVSDHLMVQLELELRYCRGVPRCHSVNWPIRKVILISDIESDILSREGLGGGGGIVGKLVVAFPFVFLFADLVPIGRL